MRSSPRSTAIVEHLRLAPGETAFQIAKAVVGPEAVQQQVHADLLRLVRAGVLRRDESTAPHRYHLAVEDALVQVAKSSPAKGVAVALSEDEIKTVLADHLQRTGWQSTVKMGHERGIDIEAHRGAERWIIEVKGPGSLQPMRVNYFLAILGETLQRMDDPHARYSIALPDLPQFRGLWRRLPDLAKRRTTIDALFVDADGTIDAVS